MGIVWVVAYQAALYGLWSLAESVGVRLLLRFWYTLPVPALRLPRTLAALAYLAYCITRSYRSLETDAYALLRVSPTADEPTIKRQFRELAKILHPDKGGASHDDAFIQVHTAYSVLSDPVRRFAYDRFGNDIHRWRTASSLHDFMSHGLTNQAATFAHLALLQAVFWMMHGSTRGQGVGAGTFWGALVLVTAAWMCFDLVVTPRATPVFGVPPYMLVSLLEENVMSFLLVLQQCHASLSQLLAFGSRAHFSFANAAPAQDTTDIAQLQLIHFLREEPRTLPDAKRQLELVAGAVLQLEMRVVGQEGGAEANGDG
ncbi:hypothetical protein MSPP1_001998 [Malassezia sp. CBS 17886]|nr:hypothetical protein MSPP1_001998 [Malassezia sp. CBS 17886]